MATLNITLTEDMKEFIEARVAEEGHASPDDYMQAVLREDRMRKAKQDLIAKLDEALAGGPAEPMTREDWDSLEREAIERLRGESIKP